MAEFTSISFNAITSAEISAGLNSLLGFFSLNNMCWSRLCFHNGLLFNSWTLFVGKQAIIAMASTAVLAVSNTRSSWFNSRLFFHCWSRSGGRGSRSGFVGKWTTIA
jgi:hypothetical protein